MKTTFTAKPAKPGAGKTCAVCGQKHGPTFNFRRTLQFYGVKGEQATVNCVRQLPLGQREAKK